MTEPDLTMTRIGKGIELSQQGEREAARTIFGQVWDDMGGEGGDPFHRCALAHSMADVQADVQDELVWDLRALVAREHLERGQAAVGTLGDDGYGQLVKGGLDRLAERLAVDSVSAGSPDPRR